MSSHRACGRHMSSKLHVAIMPALATVLLAALTAHAINDGGIVNRGKALR